MPEETKKKLGTADDPTQDPNDLGNKTLPPAREVEGRDKSGKPIASGPVRGTAEAAKEQKTVTMFFPSRVTLTVTGHQSHTFGPGVTEVPEEFANHSYLKDNGAYIYKKGAEPEEARGRLVDSISGVPVAPEESIPGDTKELSIFDRDPSTIRAQEVHILDQNRAQQMRREERLNAGESPEERSRRLEEEQDEQEEEGPKLNRDSEGATTPTQKRKDPVESADSIASKSKSSKKEDYGGKKGD